MPILEGLGMDGQISIVDNSGVPGACWIIKFEHSIPMAIVHKAFSNLFKLRGYEFPWSAWDDEGSDIDTKPSPATATIPIASVWMENVKKQCDLIFLVGSLAMHTDGIVLCQDDCEEAPVDWWEHIDPDWVEVGCPLGILHKVMVWLGYVDEKSKDGPYEKLADGLLDAMMALLVYAEGAQVWTKIMGSIIHWLRKQAAWHEEHSGGKDYKAAEKYADELHKIEEENIPF